MKRWQIGLIAGGAAIIGFAVFWVILNHTSPSAYQLPVNCSHASAPVISYDGNEFTPDCVIVKPGTTITFHNQAQEILELGAGTSPSDSSNETITKGEYALPIPVNKETSVTLSKAGTYPFHDHLNPSVTGVVKVQ